MNDKITRLIDTYINGLTDRIARIDAATNAITSGGFVAAGDCRNRPEFKALLDEAHKLAGSAGSMGFDHLGRAAAALDVLMQALADRKQAPDTTNWNQVSVLQSRVVALARDLSAADSSLRMPEGAVQEPEEDWEPGGGGGKTILSVGMPADDAGRLCSEIAPFGFILEAVEAVDELDSAVARPDVVAVLSGLPASLLEKVSVVAETAGRPVIAFDDAGALPERVAAFRCGARAFLVAPFDAADLVDAVDRCIPGGQGEALRVLAIDDDEAMLSLYTYVLGAAGMEVRTESDPADALEAVAAFKPDLLVIDRKMPTYSGIEVAAAIRQQSSHTSLPVVFLSRETAAAARLESMTMGGDDYLTKPIDMDDLIGLVKARGARAREIKSLIVRDSMTGLHNHASFMTDLDHSLAMTARYGQPLSVAIIDIDFFKKVNDTWGHQAGDAVLQSLSRLLRQRLRRSDLAGRLGGEEFAVLLPGTDGSQAKPVIEGLLALFREVSHHTEAGSFSVTFSAGVASYPACKDVASLMRAADAALYQAKGGGRNTVISAS